MIRAARRASLLPAFCLLASAATAHSECAWVFGRQVSVKNRSRSDAEDLIVAADSTERQCRGLVVETTKPVQRHRAVLAEGGAEPLAFPPSVLTSQDKIDWLTTQTDLAAQAVDAEAEKPLPQQREALYRAALERGADLIRLINTIAGRLPRLEARVNETMTKATGGLERIANGRLKIGMSTEEVRQIRGEPSAISEMTTAVGEQQQWQYGATVLLFDRGKLVEIRQMLKSE